MNFNGWTGAELERFSIARYGYIVRPGDTRRLVTGVLAMAGLAAALVTVLWWVTQ